MCCSCVCVQSVYGELSLVLRFLPEVHHTHITPPPRTGRLDAARETCSPEPEATKSHKTLPVKSTHQPTGAWLCVRGAFVSSSHFGVCTHRYTPLHTISTVSHQISSRYIFFHTSWSINTETSSRPRTQKYKYPVQYRYPQLRVPAVSKKQILFTMRVN